MDRHTTWTGHGEADPARLLQQPAGGPDPDTIEGLKAAALLRRAQEAEEGHRALARAEAEGRRLWGDLLRQFGRAWPALAAYVAPEPPDEFLPQLAHKTWLHGVVRVHVPGHEPVYTLYTTDRERQAWTHEEVFRWSERAGGCKYQRWVTAGEYQPSADPEEGYARHGDRWFSGDDLGEVLLAAEENHRGRQEAAVKGKGLANAAALRTEAATLERRQADRLTPQEDLYRALLRVIETVIPVRE